MAEETDRKTTWEELRTVIQGRWTELTTDDVNHLKQKAGQLAQIVQQRYGISLDDAKKQVNDFEQSLESQVGEYYKTVAAQINGRYRSARQNVSSFAGDVRDFGLGTTLVDVARHNPLFALGTAFTVGFLLHAAITPRRKYHW